MILTSVYSHAILKDYVLALRASKTFSIKLGPIAAVLPMLFPERREFRGSENLELRDKLVKPSVKPLKPFLGPLFELPINLPDEVKPLSLLLAFLRP